MGTYIHRIHLSIDYALSVSYRRDLRDGNSNFVARVTLVKGIPFYGFHVGYRYFLKIYVLDPKVMTRLADLLRQGVIMKQVFQPFEAHLQYLLQWMVDYNLYGCDYIDCSKAFFRFPVPSYERLSSPSHLWHHESVPNGKVSEKSDLPRASHCSIEVDICVQDILNRHDIKPRSLHHDFIEHLHPVVPDEKLVRSMASLWKDEARRRKSRSSQLEMGNDHSGDMPISMSAGLRISEPGEWIHEVEYRERMMNLITDEKSNDDETTISFSTFVKHSPLDPTIRTSLESVEDLFPSNLNTSFGLSQETETEINYDTGYDDRIVDEKRILTLNMNDREEINSDSDSDSDITSEPLTRGKLGDHSNESDFNPSSSSQEANRSTRALHTGSDISRPKIDSLSSSIGFMEPEVKEPGHTSDDWTPLSYHLSLRHLSQIPDGSLKRLEPPENQHNTVKKRQKIRFDQIHNRDARADESVFAADLESVQNKIKANNLPEGAAGSNRDGGNKWIEAHNATAKTTPFLITNLSTQPTKESPQKISIRHDRMRTHTLRFPIAKDSHALHTAARPSQKIASPLYSPQNTRANPVDDFMGYSIASSPVWPPITNFWSSARTSTTSAPGLPLHIDNSFAKRLDRPSLLTFLEQAPSPDVVISTIQSLGLPRVIYQDAFYSSESDVPDHSREWAGREFRLTSLTTPFLPEFNPNGASETSCDTKPSIVLDKLKREEEYQHRRRACALQSWEIATPPPSQSEVHGWYHAEERASISSGVKSPGTSEGGCNAREKSQLSQIDGPTQKSKHGFKYTQNAPLPINAKQDTQYMSTMSLELHVNTRADFVPDPEQDEVQCLFWCFQSDEARLKNISGLQDSRLGVVVASEDGSMSRKIAWHRGLEIHEESCELDLMVRMVEIVRDSDPDILTGFEVHGSSWGYLIERARLKYDYNLNDEFSRIKAQSYKRIAKDNDQWGLKTTSTIRITGRHVINIWRAMRSELNLLQYTMENVAFHLLHRRIPHFTWSDLTKWYTSGKPKDISKVIAYYLSRVKVDVEILERNELIPRTSEQARVLGVDFFSVFSRGSQFKVESLMFRIAKPENFLLISPSRKQIGGQNALECLPLVMEPQSAFYNSPLLVLDFQSLYPSVMIAYNYCYSTCLGRVVNWRGTNKMGFTEFKREQRLLELLKDHINIAPNGIMYTKPEIRTSLLAKMLREILETRVMVKNGMKADKTDKALQRLLNNRQLALKLIANVTYGYTSASFSGRMPCSEIADSIVQTGRETLEKAIALIHSVERWGAEVVYGDTDSLFVYLKGRTKDQAFDIGQEIAETITNMNPSPVKLKFEKVYFPSILLAKKRYVGFKYDSRDQVEPIFDAKGIETVRRDGTPAEQMIEEKALKILFRTSDLSKVKDYFQKQCEKIMKGSVSIQDFCFAREVKLGTYSGKGPPPPGALISTKRMLLDARAEPQYGERIRYVVVTGAPGARLIDRCVAPEELLYDDHAELDGEYYILKNLIPPLERIFNLVGANVRSWYDEMPKFQRIRQVGNSAPLPGHSKEPGINKKTLESYMKSSSCLVCGERIDSDNPLCTTCYASKSLSLLSLQSRLDNTEREFLKVQKLCQSCSGISPLDEVRCDSKDCPVFYTRTKQRSRLNTVRSVVEPVVEKLKTLEW